MRRVENKVSLAEAQQRLKAYRHTAGSGPHHAATLAGVIWPDTRFRAAQGAGAAASRVLKKLGCYWTGTRTNWGWMLSFTSESTSHETSPH